ncbi:MAG: hypothetical protein BRD21_08130, partial [Halobacteriales archaeon SW_8_66_22]
MDGPLWTERHAPTLAELPRVSGARLLGGMAVGTVIIYAVGVPFLWYNLAISVRTAIITGAVVFVPAEAAKAVAAYLIV